MQNSEYSCRYAGRNIQKNIRRPEEIRAFSIAYKIIKLKIMKLFIRAKPNSKRTRVEKISDNTYLVEVKEPPIDGRANKAVIKALAEFLNIAPSRIKLIQGATSKQKILEIFI